MNKYFIYYSYTGNGDYLASELEKNSYTIIKVEPLKPFGKLSFFKMLSLGGDAMFKKCRPIKELNLELKEDDVVVIGSPIWNDRLSTPINSVLAKYQFSKEMTQFVLYPAGTTTKKSLKQIKALGFTKEPVVVPSPIKNQATVIDKLA